MYVLATAVLTASLLGSMHCVGMCGPLAIWASGASDGLPRRKVWFAGSLYHLGRLVTYTLAGFLAGGIGSLVDLGGQAIGYQLMAARLVGGAMVLVGLFRLRRVLFPQAATGVVPPSRIGGLLVRLRPYIVGLPLPGRALATGLLTTLLPCGWLYLFALVAAGTGSIFLGPVVMIAFWVGTVPALVALVAGTQFLSRRFTLAIPALAAILLVVAGGFTASGRGFANLGSLSQLHSAVEETQSSVAAPDRQIEAISKTPLPCCQARQAAKQALSEK